MVVDRQSLDAETARKIFQYDNGILYWKIKPARRIAIGSRAGHVSKEGYTRVRVNKKMYLVHRLVWLIHHGTWPTAGLDHINGNPADNRIENLREANQAQNMQNRVSAQSNSKSGILGVSFHTASGKWRATICVDGTYTHLGTFHDKEQAEAVYAAAKERLHPYRRCNEKIGLD